MTALPASIRKTKAPPARPHVLTGIEKVPSGIAGLDEITGGGLPAGRTTLVCGGAGCGKTLFAMEFIVKGATGFGEPGVVIAFEESAAELAANREVLEASYLGEGINS